MNFKDSIFGIVDKKTVAVLRFFMNNKKKEFCLNEISQASQVPIASVHRLLRKLVKLDLIKFNKIKSLRLYRLSDNDATSFLNTLFEDSDKYIDEFIDAIIGDVNIQVIIQYGKEAKDRLNILVIGENVNPAPVKAAVYAIKEKYDITLNTLVLEPEQYVQMSDMGLYSGKKKQIFSR